MVTYIPGVEYIIGAAFGPATGSPLIAGLLLTLALFALWAYVGAGLEAAVALFIPLLIFLANQGLLPFWVLILTSTALAFTLMFLYRSYGRS